MENFSSFGLPKPLLQSLEAMGFKNPTPIQAETIPLALEGHDILGTAQTGTGKTAAFGIPLIASLMEGGNGTALVVAPTRELASQVMASLKDMLGNRNKYIKSVLLIGGESIGKQLNQLKRRPRLIVGTPGRINDHLSRRTLNLKENRFLVLDETDRMLDMGFSIQINNIVKHMPEERQTLLFSATMPKNIIKLAENYMQEPKRISVGSTVNPVENIKQDVVSVSEENKYTHLLAELEAREGSVIVFVKTKRKADKLAQRLRSESVKADSIHGDLKHNRRERVIREFRAKKYRVLVATDVAARGLDIPHIEHVINYDLPQCPEDYIHRIGRTARAGANGNALCLVSSSDKGKWNAIRIMMDPNAKSEEKRSFKNKKNKGKKRNSRYFKKSSKQSPKKASKKRNFRSKPKTAKAA